MRPTGVLVKPGLAVLLEAVDPLTLVPRMGMGGLAGYAEAFGKFRDGVVIQLIVFEESRSLFAHGNPSPGHGHLLLAEASVTHVLRICVTHVPVRSIFVESVVERVHLPA